MVELTNEQVKAYEGLEIAIRAVLEADNMMEEGQPYVVSDFIVLAALQRVTQDGYVQTVYPALFKDGDMPWYKILGLMHKHALQMDQMSLDGDDNG